MTAQEHDIAVIGLACRFPGGASDPESFWALLTEGRDAVTEIDEERWDPRLFGHPRRGAPGRSVTFAAGVVPGYKYFDADFFDLSPKEAAAMDPQQRLALELTWEALEDAGLKPSDLAGREVGVYIGTASPDTGLSRADDVGQIDEFSMLGLNLSIVANRVSHRFDFRGPSLVLDTACSSSLTALHEACLALTRGGLPLAVAGGVHILLSPNSFIGFSRAGMLAPDGRCRPFDEAGQGYVRAEGGGLFILKPYKEALRDGDRVWARIRATALNANGRTAGVALPDQEAQSELLAGIYNRPGRLARLAYLEAHGTGTSVGDPIEASAIGKALPPFRRPPLWIGSVKGNLGHLETASGAAGLMKAVLVLRHGLIPPSLHFVTPNPRIDFEGLKLRVPVENQPLPEVRTPALAGVNSFGFGGVNAHVLIEAGPEKRAAAVSAPRPARRGEAQRAESPLFLPLAAKSRASLLALAGAYADYLDKRPETPASDVAASVLAFREALPHRVVVSGGDRAELVANLRRAAADEAQPARGLAVFGEALAEKGRPGTVFMFSGNGGIWPEMGRDLLGYDRAFTETVEEIDELMRPLSGWSVREALASPRSPKTLSLICRALPLSFALQAGLFKALVSRGLEPQMVMGHSFGELPAAWAAGCLDLKDAVTLVHYRGLVQDSLRGQGSLAAVGVSAEKAARWIEEHGLDLEISAFNAPKSVTLTGAAESLDRLRGIAKKERCLFVRLNVQYPFHGRLMNRLKGQFRALTPKITPRAGEVPFISTVTGRQAPGRSLGLEYWWRNMARPVRFQAALETALESGARFFLEVGASKTLDLYVRETSSFHALSAAALATLVRDGNSPERLEMSWKAAWTKGWPVDWTRHFPGRPPRLDLPRYAWNREYHWTEPSPDGGRLVRGRADHPLLGWRRSGSADLWENQIDRFLEPWLVDHQVAGRVVFPAAAMAEMALKAAALALDTPCPEVENLRLPQSLELTEHLRVLETQADRRHLTFRLSARRFLAREPWVLHAEGRLRAGSEAWAAGLAAPPADPENFGEALEGERLYDLAALSRLEYGPAFRAVERLWVNEAGEVLLRFGPRAPDFGEGPDYLLPPRLLDGAFQALFLGLALAGFSGVYLPHWLGRLSFLGGRGRPAYALAAVRRATRDSVQADFTLFDEQGRGVARALDCRLVRVEAASVASAAGLLQTSLEAAEPSRRRLADMDKIAPALNRDLKEALSGPAGRLPEEAGKLLRLSLLTAAREWAGQAGTAGRRPKFPLDRPEESGRLAYKNFLWEFLERHGQARRENGSWRLAGEATALPFATLWRTLIGEYPEAVTEARLAALAEAGLRGLAAHDRTDDRAEELGRLAREARRLFFSAHRRVTVFYQALGRVLSGALSRLPAGALLKVLALTDAPRVFWENAGPFFKGRAVDLTVWEPGEAGEGNGRTQATGESRWRFESGTLDDLAGRREAFDLVLVPWLLSGEAEPERFFASLKGLLSPGGLFLAPELPPADFFDLLLGLEPWWWDLSQDPEAPVSRLRTAEEWEETLARAGLASPEVWAGADDLLLLTARAEASAGLADGGGEGHDSVWVAAQAAPSAFAVRWLEGFLEHRSGRPAPGIIRGRGAPDGLDLDDPEAWAGFFRKAGSGDRLSLIFAVGLDNEAKNAADEDMGLSRLTAAAMLVKGWDLAGRPPLRLWLLSGGALPLSPERRPVPGQAALWGYGRTLMNELPGLDVRLVDLYDPDPGLWLSWEAEVAAGAADREAVLADGLILLPRLGFQPFPEGLGPGLESVPAAMKIDFPWLGRPETETSGGRPVGRAELKAVLAAWREFLAEGRAPSPAAAPRSGRPDACLSLAMGGARRHIENLEWRPGPPLGRPGPGLVKVEVEAAGLNFRDVMWASGLLPEAALTEGFFGPNPGLEGAGRVVETGAGVSRAAVGDRVMFFAPRSFAGQVITPETAVMVLPDSLSSLQAAGLPVAYGTVWFALGHLGRLRPGESLLIHSAAGGVGLAALEAARVMGLTALVTAGSEERRGFLKLMGAAEAFDSRSLDFADRILDLTGGRGVDAVLNSIAGEAAARSLAVLAPGGRFLELGKRDFYQDSSLSLYPFRRNLSYFGIDVDQVMVHDAPRAAALAAELEKLFREGEVKALPCTVFPAENIQAAFMSLKESRPIGKVVVDLGGLASERPPLPAGLLKRPAAPPPAPWVVREEGTYLVSGGTGGFGLATARHLLRQGAGHLLLLGRRPAEGELAEFLAGAGGRAALLRVDAADGAALSAALAGVLSGRPPLKGLIHAAAAYDDAAVTNITPESLALVMAAKARGAWNLHRFTRNLDLDFFILYSSLAALIGNPGQAAYVAANTALENLAVYRRSLGLPALAVRWGAISDAGLLARRPELLGPLEKLMGERPLAAGEALSMLPALLRCGAAVATPARSKWRGTRMLPILATPLFAALNPASRRETESLNLADLVSGLAPEKAVKAVIRHVTDRLAEILRLPAKRIAPEAPFSSFGMDSLMMAELLSGLEAAAGGVLNLGALSQDESIRGLAEKLYLELAQPELAKLGAEADDRVFLENMARRHGVEMPSGSN